MAKDVEFEEVDGPLIEDEDQPIYGGENWEEHVMGLFRNEEVYEDKNGGRFPSLNGLRRVALSLFGAPIKSGPVLVQSNLPHSSYCVYSVVWNDMEFSAAADAHQDNIGGNYGIYPTTIAESRAEARAYRKALLLSTASAEEIKGNEESSFNSVLTVNSENVIDENGPISEQQKTIIKSKCKKLKINLDKFLNENSISELDSMTKSDAIALVKKISDYQTEGIPESIK